MKHRKRTNSNVPAKGRLRDMADRLWSLAVRNDWNNRCAVCGKRKCEAHHLIPRQHELTRYELLNGIALCAYCHQFDPNIAPHQNAAGWLRWLYEHRPILHAWYVSAVENNEQFDGTKTPDYYCGVIRRLREYVHADDVERICGKKFSKWLESNE